MKEKIEKFLELNQEIKQHCYELCNKWSQYRKSLEPPVSDWESEIYNYPDINNLKFKYEYGEFVIGYEHTDRCGDTENFYTYFTKEELMDENIIKQKIDKIHHKKLEQIEKKKDEERVKKLKKEKEEYDRYQELKQKFEQRIIDNTVDMDPEISKAIDDIFWETI